jgi:hypothetical protein
MSDERDVSNWELKGLLEWQGRLLMEVRDDVKAQNGRVRTLETNVAVLESLDDQSRDDSARWIGWGGVATGVAAFLWSLFHKGS